MNHKSEPWRATLAGNTELDALLDRVREDKRDTTGKNRSQVAYDCWRMFEDLAKRYKEEFAMRDRYQAQARSRLERILRQGELLNEIARLDDGDEQFAWKHADLFNRIRAELGHEQPHVSDCGVWVHEPCNCVTGKDVIDWRDEWQGQSEL